MLTVLKVRSVIMRIYYTIKRSISPRRLDTPERCRAFLRELKCTDSHGNKVPYEKVWEFRHQVSSIENAPDEVVISRAQFLYKMGEWV